MTAFTAQDYRRRARQLAKLFCDSEKKKEEAFQDFVRDCIDTHKATSKVAELAAKEFQKNVPDGKRSFYWLDRNLFEPIMTLLSDELPTPLQFAGLADIRVNALLGNNRYYVDILIAMRELGQNAELALKRLKPLTEAAEARRCALLWYAIGRCHSKLNNLHDAVPAYRFGSELTHGWLKAERRECHCQDKCSNEQLAIEFGRGLAATLRKQFTSSMGKDATADEVCAAFDKVRNLYEELQTRTPKDELNRAGADLFFSIGYFHYEQFFEMTFGSKCWGRTRPHLNRDPDKIRAEAFDIYGKAWDTSAHQCTGALYGLATLYLCDNEYVKAFQAYMLVLTIDGAGTPADALNVEHALAGICIRIVIAHLEEIGWTSGTSESVAKIQSDLKAVCKRGITKGPADCHSFNLLVLESIFKDHGKPFSPELQRTADLLFARAHESVREAVGFLRGTHDSAEKPTPEATTSKRFAVALSYPSEKRDFVEQVAAELRKLLGRDRIFYDQDSKPSLPHLNSGPNLQRIYREESELVVIFACEEYAASDWCRQELRAIQALASRHSDRVMLLRFDDTPIDGIYDEIDSHFSLARGQKPEKVALEIHEYWKDHRPSHAGR